MLFFISLAKTKNIFEIRSETFAKKFLNKEKTILLRKITRKMNERVFRTKQAKFFVSEKKSIVELEMLFKLRKIKFIFHVFLLL